MWGEEEGRLVAYVERFYTIRRSLCKIDSERKLKRFQELEIRLYAVE
jgi:hypothetical protein